MPHASKVPSHADTLSSGASLGGTVSHYRRKQDVYAQGAAAGTLFYIQEVEGQLTQESKNRRSAVIAILGERDFGGERGARRCPGGLPTAVAMTGSPIPSIPKHRIIELLQTKNKASI